MKKVTLFINLFMTIAAFLLLSSCKKTEIADIENNCGCKGVIENRQVENKYTVVACHPDPDDLKVIGWACVPHLYRHCYTRLSCRKFVSYSIENSFIENIEINMEHFMQLYHSGEIVHPETILSDLNRN